LDLERPFTFHPDGKVEELPEAKAADKPQQIAQRISPRQRIWRRFKSNRLGYWSLVIFLSLYVLSLLGEVISNDKPLLIYHQQQLYFPLLKDYSETEFG